jgi:uncharacterized protein (DUF58 family)
MPLKAEARSLDLIDKVMPLTAAKPAAPVVRSVQKRHEVLIHVRFHPNAQVNTIDKCPEGLSGQDWFYRLRTAATQHYQTFAGGRGVFRMPRSTFEAILSQDASQTTFHRT